MLRSYPRILLTALVISAAAMVAVAEAPRCSFTARECEQQIRQMLTGRRFLGVQIEEKNPGLVIKTVAPNSPAARAGLKPGDRLIAVNGKSLTQATSLEFKQIISGARETGRLFMIIWRRGSYTRIEARLEPYTKEQIDKIINTHLIESHTSTAGGGH
jgi:membrane-associated protease RseP (regulator of RpoE activity)